MKIIYNTVTNSLHKYPRSDDEPVIGLSPELEVFDLIMEEKPIAEVGYFYTKSEPIIDTVNKIVAYEWVLNVIESDPEPNYVQFLNDVIASQIYQKAITQAISNPVVNVGFTTTMGALILAAGGNPNPAGIMSAFNLMLSQMILEEGDINELQGLIDTNNMSGSVDLSGFF